MQKGEFRCHVLQVHAHALSRMAGTDDVCRILEENSKGPESEWEYNMEMVCERRAIGDTELHREIVTLNDFKLP